MTATTGRLDQLTESGQVDGIIRPLSRFSGKVRVTDVSWEGNLKAKQAAKIGPDLICARPRREPGTRKTLENCSRAGQRVALKSISLGMI